ncbi:hypothetical protein KBI23_15040 [bacterium]|nr:hypothetical protein [bacterium]MBP9809562.1 hypothetical protein [bacterium]
MDSISYYVIAFQLVPVALALANWLLSLYFAPKSNYFITDLKQLWPDSRPFLKTQWPFLAVCMLGSNLSQAHLISSGSIRPEFSFGLIIASLVSSGILPILKLFYVSYLAAPKYPGRVATIGIWSVLLYVMGDWFISTLGTLGLAFLVAPGLVILIRTCLFLPIYALEGHHPIAAFEKSWSLTAGHYWPISRYLGLPTILFGILILSPQVATVIAATGHYPMQYSLPLVAAAGAATLALSLVIAGLTYKLYERLSTAGETID